MHNLEHLLVILSERIRQSGNDELADAASELIGVSMTYVPDSVDDAVAGELNDRWSRQYLPPVREYRKLYVIQDPASGHLKIGKAFDPEDRLSQFQTGTPHQLTILHTHSCEDDEEAPALETMVHRILAEHRVRGEWFNVTLDQTMAAIAQARAQRSTEQAEQYRIITNL